MIIATVAPNRVVDVRTLPLNGQGITTDVLRRGMGQVKTGSVVRFNIAGLDEQQTEQFTVAVAPLLDRKDVTFQTR